MKIYLVTSPNHEGSGYGDALVLGGHPNMLVSFMDFAGKEKRLRGFKHSGRPASVQDAEPPLAHLLGVDLGDDDA